MRGSSRPGSPRPTTASWPSTPRDGSYCTIRRPAGSPASLPPPRYRRPWREVLRLDATVSELLWAAKTSGQPTSALASVLCAQGNVRTAEALAQPWTDAEGTNRRPDPHPRPHGPVPQPQRARRDGPATAAWSGADPAMTALYDLIEAIAPSDAPVVIEGEPGVGKELVAQAIHARSHRCERPLIVVDCGAVSPRSSRPSCSAGSAREPTAPPPSVGPSWRTAGRSCSTGCNAASLPAQARLLRLLETGMVERDGEGAPRRGRRPGHCRHDQGAESRGDAKGGSATICLRRLQVVRIRIPALRERRGDIALLGRAFPHPPRGAAGSFSRPRRRRCASGPASGPGNVRQLENAIREVAPGRPAWKRHRAPPASRRSSREAQRPLLPPLDYTSEDRRTVPLRALSSHGGNRTAAARALGIGRATFYRWWREAGLGA